MPTYTYRYADQPLSEPFDLSHSMREAPMKLHPADARPLLQVFSPVGLTLRQGALRSSMKESRIAANGFQKYVRQSDGSYARTVGTKGPAHICRQAA